MQQNQRYHHFYGTCIYVFYNIYHFHILVTLWTTDSAAQHETDSSVNLQNSVNFLCALTKVRIKLKRCIRGSNTPLCAPCRQSWWPGKWWWWDQITSWWHWPGDSSLTYDYTAIMCGMYCRALWLFYHISCLYDLAVPWAGHSGAE